MEKKKRSLPALFCNEVVKRIASAADWFSWLCFALFIAFIVLAISFKLHIIEAGGHAQFWDTYYWWFMYGAWVLLVVSTIGPILHITRDNGEAPLELLISIAVCHLAAFLAISIFVLGTSGNSAGITALLAAAAAAAMAGVGWVVQSHSSARTARRTHTFNVLMQSRLSKEFQEQVRIRNLRFPIGIVIDSAMAKYNTGHAYNSEIAELEKAHAADLAGAASDEEKAKLVSKHETARAQIADDYNGMQSVKYLLNFYEFLCAGIRSRDLEDKLLFDTLSAIAIGIFDDTVNIRKEVRKQQAQAFEHMDVVIEGWKKR